MLSSELEFSELLDSCKGIIFKVSRAYCREDDDRRDLRQEIAAELWRAYPRYNTAYKFSTWAYRIALNVAITFLRKDTLRKKLFVPMTAAEENRGIWDSAPGEQEHLQALMQFIFELKPYDKALILLYLDEKSHREIAEIMGITESNVSTRIARLKEKLKMKFQS